MEEEAKEAMEAMEEMQAREAMATAETVAVMEQAEREEETVHDKIVHENIVPENIVHEETMADMENSSPEASAAGEADSGPDAEPEIQVPSEEGQEGAACAALRQVYSDFDFTQEMKDPTFRALYRGERRPTLRQVYEICHRDALDQEIYQRGYQGAFLDRYQQCLGDLQRQAEARAEETVAARIAEQIRIRGARPAENGMSSRGAVRMHPDVAHMTREDRARLAQRAAQGEAVPL